MIWDVHPGSGFFPSQILKRALDPGPRSATPLSTSKFLRIRLRCIWEYKYDLAGKAASYKTNVMDPDRSDPETFKSFAGALNWNFCPVGIVLRVVSGYGINYYTQFTHIRKLQYLRTNIPWPSGRYREGTENRYRYRLAGK